MIRYILILLFSEMIAQNYKIYPYKIREKEWGKTYALTNAKVFIDYKTQIDSATIIIKNGKILRIGKGVDIPPNAIKINCSNKFIMPAFIDLYSSYGLPEKITREGGKDEPIYERTSKGPFYWNEAIHPEINPLLYFKEDSGRAELLRKCGFGAVITHIPDGIARGPGLFLFMDGSYDNAISSMWFSLNKGSSSQEYPTSKMGAYALLRQHFYDALYEIKDSSSTKDASVLATSSALTASSLFCFVADNWIESNMFLNFKKEFSLKRTVIVAGGTEYRYPWLFNGEAVIFPLSRISNLHKDIKISEADLVPLMELKHWELSPSLPPLLTDHGATVSLSSYGIKSEKDFLSAIRRVAATSYDIKKFYPDTLFKENAHSPDTLILKMLTYNPAKIIGMEEKLAKIKEGNFPFFIITEGMPTDSNFVVYEMWIKNSRYTFHDLTLPDIRGNWKLHTSNDTVEYLLEIFGNLVNPVAKFYYRDKTSHTVKITNPALYPYTITIDLREINDTNFKGIYTGIIELTDDSIISLKLEEVRSKKQYIFKGRKAESYAYRASPPQKDTTGNLWFPFSPYGREKPLIIAEEQKRKYLLKNGTVWLFAPDTILTSIDILIENGKIKKIGKDLSEPGAIIVNCTGKHITPAIIDEHSHIAIYGGVNESGDAISSEVRIKDVIDPEDINIFRELSGGVGISHLLHGSANPIGGQTVVVKMLWGVLPQQMIFEKAPPFIKFALGENVKQSNWGDKYTKRYPQTRSGVREIIRDAFILANDYLKRKKSGNYKRDLRLEAIAEILEGKRHITCHSYVQSEILMLIELSKEMGFKVNTFTHGLETYKVAQEVKEAGASASVFSDWWAYKFEVYEAIPYNAFLLWKNGVNVGINSDDASMARRLNQEAAKTIKYGGVPPLEALKMVTLNPAKMLHIDGYTGSIAEGKDADIVIWSENPLSQYAIVEKTFVSGILMFDRDSALLTYYRRIKEYQRLYNKLIKKLEKE